MEIIKIIKIIAPPKLKRKRREDYLSRLSVVFYFIFSLSSSPFILTLFILIFFLFLCSLFLWSVGALILGSTLTSLHLDPFFRCQERRDFFLFLCDNTSRPPTDEHTTTVKKLILGKGSRSSVSNRTDITTIECSTSKWSTYDNMSSRLSKNTSIRPSTAP